MKVNDMIFRSHLVTDGELTEEQIKTIETLLATSPVFKDIVNMLSQDGHKIIHKHENDISIEKSYFLAINRDNKEISYLDHVAKTIQDATKEHLLKTKE